jgi:hypothetical protein
VERRLKVVSAGRLGAAVASVLVDAGAVRLGSVRVDWVVAATRRASPVQRAAWYHQMSL